MIGTQTRTVSWPVVLFATAVVVLSVAWTATAHAQDCTSLLGLFQQGLSDGEVANATGLSTNSVAACRHNLQQPIPVGPAPLGAAGPAAGNAPGPAPFGAAGRPPLGAAGRPPIGAAGAPPLGRSAK